MPCTVRPAGRKMKSPLTLCHRFRSTSGHSKPNLFNDSSAGPRGRDPHVTRYEDAHGTRLQPGTQSSSSAAADGLYGSELGECPMSCMPGQCWSLHTELWTPARGSSCELGWRKVDRDEQIQKASVPLR
ncbi:hypothetical protein KUCAC02_018567 [Chaenocephalus aceratus]|uniref:Uncharacterized protein n=1 Tax=Chaenocephalus aceratus TaxID=36190 RepID=A0ACB9W8V2_CHAAC|nr:hypothetical protein KUCAC02_018567 [Chaenocephalus aceratus]